MSGRIIHRTFKDIVQKTLQIETVCRVRFQHSARQQSLKSNQENYLGDGTRFSVKNYEENNIIRKGRLKGLNLTVLSENAELLSKLTLKVKSKKTRDKSGLMMLEGKRLIKDAVDAGVVPEYIFFSRKKDITELNLSESEVKFCRTPYKELQLWSDLTTSPGIIAFCKIPPPTLCRSEESFPVTVICDQIRDPGNLGSIIRNTAAVGVSKLILSPGCTDPWDAKVLRSAMGGHFKLPIYKTDNWNIKEYLPEKTIVYLADNNCNRTKNDEKEDLPLYPYYSVNFSDNDHITVIVGGETEGLGDDAFQFAHETRGRRITVPLSNNVESLNSGVAIGIILFEIKRQKIISLIQSSK